MDGAGVIRLWPAAMSGTPRRHVSIGVGRGSSGIHRDVQDGAGLVCGVC